MTDYRSAGEQMLDEARVEISALTAENARLRGEVEAAWRDNDVLRRDLAVVGEENARLRKAAMNAQVLADERRAEIERLNASRVALCNACKDCPDLARVTAERAGLLAAARAVFSTWICLRDAGRLVPRGLECGCESLGSAIAACAPPASGEE